MNGRTLGEMLGSLNDSNDRLFLLETLLRVESLREVTTLHEAAKKENSEMLRKLLEVGHDVDEVIDGFTPLMWACRFGRPENVKLLLDAGANVNFRDMIDEGNWQTPLSQTINCGNNAEIAALLVARDANIEDAEKGNGIKFIDALMCADENSSPDQNKIRMAEELSQLGFTTDALPLHAVARKANSADELLNLIKADCDIDAVDEDGWTALMLACHFGHYENARLLVEAGANVNHRKMLFNDENCDEWHTPLSQAIKCSHNMKITALLLANGANVEEAEKGNGVQFLDNYIFYQGKTPKKSDIQLAVKLYRLGLRSKDKMIQDFVACAASNDDFVSMAKSGRIVATANSANKTLLKEFASPALKPKMSPNRN